MMELCFVFFADDIDEVGSFTLENLDFEEQ